VRSDVCGHNLSFVHSRHSPSFWLSGRLFSSFSTVVSCLIGIRGLGFVGDEQSTGFPYRSKHHCPELREKSRDFSAHGFSWNWCRSNHDFSNQLRTDER
jgi:hypothetical protein